PCVSRVKATLLPSELVMPAALMVSWFPLGSVTLVAPSVWSITYTKPSAVVSWKTVGLNSCVVSESSRSTGPSLGGATSTLLLPTMLSVAPCVLLALGSSTKFTSLASIGESCWHCVVSVSWNLKTLPSGNVMVTKRGLSSCRQNCVPIPVPLWVICHFAPSCPFFCRRTFTSESVQPTPKSWLCLSRLS